MWATRRSLLGPQHTQGASCEAPGTSLVQKKQVEDALGHHDPSRLPGCAHARHLGCRPVALTVPLEVASHGGKG